RVERLQIGRRVAPRRPSDRRLIDEHALDETAADPDLAETSVKRIVLGLEGRTGTRVAPGDRPARPGRIELLGPERPLRRAARRRDPRAAGERTGRRERLVEDVAHERALPGAADPRDAGEEAQRNRDIDVLEVVAPGARDLEAARGTLRASRRRRRQRRAAG